MRSFPKLRPTGWDALVIGIILVLAVGCGIRFWGQNTAGQETLTAVISVDGAEADRIPLDAGQDTRRTYTHNGYTLTVILSAADGVWVQTSDCPTQDCVHTGTITRGGQSIVCLPARIVIQLQGGTEKPDVDAVLG